MNTIQELHRPTTGAELVVSDLTPLWQSFTEHSPLAMIAAEGPAHRVRYANPAFCRLAGTTNDALIDRPFAEAVPEAAQNACAALLDRVYQTGHSQTLSDQKHLSSQPFPVYWSYTAWAIREEAESPSGVVVQVSDTTAGVFLRQQALSISEALTLCAVRQHEVIELAQAGERRIHQAMSEADHRIKNHLQSICAMIDMQVMINPQTVPASELSQIQSRIKTLAAIHDMLTKDMKHDIGANGVAVGHILQQLLPMLQQIVGIEPIVWSADDSWLPIKKGVALAIIVNELVMNAVKHGANKVELQFTTSARTMSLLVYDDGPGFPEGFDPRITENFGMQLVESVSRLELSGQLSFENRPTGGAHIFITFPCS